MEKPPRSDRSRVRRPIHALAAALVACGLLVAPSGARAQDLAPPTAGASSAGGGAAPAEPAATSFGVGGEWVLSIASWNGGPSLFFRKQASGSTLLNLQPSLDYFLGNGISIGGLVGFNYASAANGGSSSTVLEFGARAGFNQALTERSSFWPTVGIIGTYQASPSPSSSRVELVVLAPFLFHVAPHFFLGAGPFLNYLVKGGPDTEYGLDFVIGGWF